MNHAPTDTPTPLAIASTERDILLALFDLGREVASMLDLEELLQKLPDLIRRLIPFDAFAIYLVDDKRGSVRVAHAVGYPPVAPDFRLKLSEGIVGQVVTTRRTIAVGDVSADP